MTIIHGLHQSDHNPHEHELLALHQVRSFKRLDFHKILMTIRLAGIFGNDGPT